MRKKIESFLRELQSDIRNISTEVLSAIEKDISLATDKHLNNKIINFLQSSSEYPILSEESEDQKNYLEYDSYYWIIDPLDGTLNFSRSVPLTCISIALWKKDEPVMGFIYDFTRDELFSGVIENDLGIESGAWLNGIETAVSTTENKKQGIISTGFPSWRSYEDNSLNKFVSKVQEWKKVRLLGTAALSIAWVGCGRFDAYIEEDIRIWDVAAGAAIVKAAGGEISIKPNKRDNFVTAIATNKIISTEELK